MKIVDLVYGITQPINSCLYYLAMNELPVNVCLPKKVIFNRQNISRYRRYFCDAGVREAYIDTEGKKPNNVVEEILVAINNSRPRHKNTIL